MKQQNFLASKFIQLHKKGLTCKEIANHLDVNIQKVQRFFRSKQIKGNIALKNSPDLVRNVLKLYQLKTSKEVALKLNLDHSKVMSIIETARRQGKIKSKDNRIKDEWTVKEEIEMFKLGGIIDRDSLAKIVGRGSYYTIKERFSKYGISAKNVNGMSLRCFRGLFGFSPSTVVEFQKAGVTKKIVPWEYMATVNCDPMLKKIFEIYYMFQCFIWKTNRPSKKIGRILCKKGKA